jgi:hypothetical protein
MMIGLLPSSVFQCGASVRGASSPTEQALNKLNNPRKLIPCFFKFRMMITFYPENAIFDFGLTLAIQYDH